MVDWFESQEVKNSKTLNVKKSTSRSEKSRGQEVEAFKSRRPKLTDVETLGFRPRLQFSTSVEVRLLICGPLVR